MIAVRSLSIKRTDLPPNTLVLGPAASHKMYGPTLSCLASWFDLERRLAMVPNLVLEQAEAETAMSSKVSGRGRKAADISQGSDSAEEAQGDSKRRHVEAAVSTSTQAASAAAMPACGASGQAVAVNVRAGVSPVCSFLNQCQFNLFVHFSQMSQVGAGALSVSHEVLMKMTAEQRAMYARLVESMAQEVLAEPVISREQSASQSSSRSEEDEEPESFDQSK
jgi:hypothetical protein